MERYFEERVAPRLDAFERRIDKAEQRLHDLSTKFTTAPTFDMEINGNSPDLVLETARRAYELFGARTNFNLKIKLDEAIQTEEGEENG